MTTKEELRDEIARQVLDAQIEKFDSGELYQCADAQGVEKVAGIIANLSYAIADAMIKARGESK